MRLLVTRPHADAQSTAATITARGHTPIVAPLMEIDYREGKPVTLDGVQAILATSANGVRALARRGARRDLPLYAVGPQTAEAAREAGFANVISADGDSAALVEKVATECAPSRGALFHAAGAKTAGRLREALQERGFTMQSAILYDAVPVESLSETVLDALRNNTLDGVLLFSPRSAKIYAALVNGAGLAENCARLEAFCISSATAAALGPLGHARIVVAAHPNQQAMLALLPSHAPGAQT